jgi:hypothetical protein
VAPPAPNWMPTSGLAFKPAFWTCLTKRSQLVMSEANSGRQPQECNRLAHNSTG